MTATQELLTDDNSGFSGSGEAKGHYPAAPTRAAFTPSTHTFTVPKEANGARYVRLTRYEAGKARKIVKHGRLLIKTKDHTYDTSGARLR